MEPRYNERLVISRYHCIQTHRRNGKHNDLWHIRLHPHTRLARNTAENAHHSPTNTVTFLSLFFCCRRSLRCKAPCKRMQRCCSTIPNIVGCYMFASVSHPVACCCVLLGVVAQSLKPIKLLSQQLPTFRLFRDRRSVAQQCWIRLHSSSNIVGATHAHYTWSPKSYGLYPSHDALQVPTLLGVVASVYTPLSTRTQQLPTLLAQQSQELLRPLARSLTERCTAVQINERLRANQLPEPLNLA